MLNLELGNKVTYKKQVGIVVGITSNKVRALTYSICPLESLDNYKVNMNQNLLIVVPATSKLVQLVK